MDEFIPRKERREQERTQQSAQLKSENMRRMGRRILLWVSVVVGIAAFVGLMGYLISNQSTGGTANGPVADVTSADWIEGGKDAKVTLIEYGDFQCPACGSYYPMVKNLNKDFGDKLRIVFRNFPLTQIHSNAQIASQAAEAAGLQNKFWEMHDMLFENQKEWSNLSNPKSTFRSYAEKIGMDAGKFETDIGAAAVKSLVDEDVKSGNAAKVSSTPSFFLNGKYITSPSSYDSFRTAIAQELDRNP